MFRRKRKGSDFTAEIAEHIRLESERLREQGLRQEDARAAARRAFGNVMRAEERFYEAHRWMWWDHFVKDVRFGLRMLRRNAGFTVTVVLTLALAIGANTAIFSIVNALLLKPLPYAHPERLGAIYARTTGPDSYDMRRNIDGEQWELLRDDVPSLLAAISGGRTSGVNLQSGAHVQYLQAGRVSAHYFEVLGVQPILGRNFTEDEDRPHGPKAAILSYGLWRTTFGANADIVGQTMRLKGEPFTIIGVLPQAASTPLNADVYIALQPSRDGEGAGTNFQAITRLSDGADWQEADAEMNRAWAGSRRVQFVHRNPGAQITYYSVPLQKGQTDTLANEVVALMLSAGFILLIACANLAGLTVVRMLRRRGELATRAALGASSWQIQKQLWVENLVLAVAGGAVGVGVGVAALRGLLLMLPEHFLPVGAISLDERVLGFTVVVSLLTSILFGMLPALITKRFDLRCSMASRSVIGGGGVRLRQGLIAGEVALTVVLLAGAGLLIRTLIHLETLAPGFNPNGVMAAKASLDDVQYNDPGAFRKVLNESIAAMRQIPGVENAAMGLTLPYERAVLNGVILRDSKDAEHEITTNEIYVTPGYFETLQIPLVAGRAFTDADGPDAQAVVIINRRFARKFFQGANPVGRAIGFPYMGQDGKNKIADNLVVGVVADTVLSSAAKLNTDSEPLTSEETIYVPAAQMNDRKFLTVLHAWFQPSWIVRAAGPVQGLKGQMQSAMAGVAPNLPFSGFYDMKDVMAATLATQRIEVTLLTAMAALALLLSAIGISGLVANLVTQRTREIGIRMALGSTIREAMIHIGASGVGASGVGLLIGFGLAAVALRAMRSVLYGVGVYDAPTILGVTVTLAAVALLASTVPALRIAKIDPARTLREE
jgi:macrolide transport system ATP-binding/permease protein